MSGDELDLDAIEARLATARRTPPTGRMPVSLYAADVDALVAEVRRLRASESAWRAHAERLAREAGGVIR